MRPILLEIGGYRVGSYGLMMFIAFISGWLILQSELKRKGLKPISSDLLLAAFIGGIIGAKVHYLLGRLDAFFNDPLHMVFSTTGLVWYGGLIGGTALFIAVLLIKGEHNAAYGDAVAPSLALGLALGRVGCQLAGDGDYGPPTDLPWGMSYPNGTVPTLEKVHPTPVYEMIIFAGLFLLLWYLRKKKGPGDGWLFALYLLLAGVARFFIEYVRRTPEVFMGLTVTQVISVGMLVGGTVWLVILYWRKRAVVAS